MTDLAERVALTPTQGEHQPVVSSESTPSRLATFATIVAAGILVAHFGLTFLHITKVNPLKIRHEAIVQGWMSPIFDQNWQLFAPDPVAVNQGVLIRSKTGGSAFQDLTTPLLLDRHHNLLPQRTSTELPAVLTRFLEIRQLLVAGYPEQPGIAEADLFLTQQELAGALKQDRVRYLEALSDLQAASVRANGFSPGTADEQYQLRIVQHVFPRWSQRDSGELGEITHSTSAWFTPPKPNALSQGETDAEND